MNNLIKKILRRIVLMILRFYGYSPFNAQITMVEIVDDFFANREMGFFRKIKYYRKGFFTVYNKGYNINCESDFSRYVPMIKYYKCHPINGIYSKWIDDKLTIRYMMSPFHEYMPEYYFQILKGRIVRLIDCPRDRLGDISGLISLLKDKGELAAKLIFGAKGKGFYKLSYRLDRLYINDLEADEEDFRSKILNMDNYILTEFITPYADIRRIYPASSNSIRIMVINDGSGARVAGAFMRFGTKKSGCVDNVAAGGYFCGVDITDGTLFRPYRYNEKMELVDTPVHLDTGEEIKGKVKSWQSITELLGKISDYLPQICYMGYDIIVTDNGFKIIEINSLQGLDIMQLYYPLMKDDLNRSFFKGIMDPGDRS